jgi:hypothetical protein
MSGDNDRIYHQTLSFLLAPENKKDRCQAVPHSKRVSKGQGWTRARHQESPTPQEQSVDSTFHLGSQQPPLGVLVRRDKHHNNVEAL